MLLSSAWSAGEGLFLNRKGEEWIKWSQKGVKLWVLEVRALKRFILGGSDVNLQLFQTTPHILSTLTLAAADWKEAEGCESLSKELIR